MKNDILLKYRMLNAEEVNREIFKDFIRYQNVTKCWRKENGKWIIKDAPFINQWGVLRRKFIIKNMLKMNRMIVNWNAFFRR